MKLIKGVAVTAILNCFVFVIVVSAQGGNTISGHVFGQNRTPLEDITVELKDDFGRSLGRIRTNTAGKYFFSRMPAGLYKISVVPLGTNYEEQEARIEIQNITRADTNGARVVGAFMNAQRDFYLRIDPKRQALAGKAETIFAQEVPKSAKDLYDEGISLIANKKKKEGYKKLIAAIEMFPDYYMAIELLGLEYFVAKHYKASSILLQRATQIHPKSYKAWYGLGRAFSSLRLHDDALAAAEKALILAPASADAFLLAGSLMRLTAKYKDSEKHLTKAKTLARNTIPDVHWELALLYGRNLKRYGDAADELEIWLKLQPKSQDAENIKQLIKTYREKSKRSD